MIALVALTATAAWAAPAAAQTVPDPDPAYSMPQGPDAPPPPHRRAAPPAGTSWQAPPDGMRGPSPEAMEQRRNFILRRMGPDHAMGPGMGPGMGPQRHVEFRRIERGGTVPQRWRGPDVQVRSWRQFGFPEPFAGGRWIRYYDDALLIDGDGRVRDSRPGWDWDRYGAGWADDDDGVPVYVGDGDDQSRGRDYRWAERYDHGEMGPGPRVRERVYMQGPPGAPMGPPPPCMRGCAGGYGYGYGANMGYGPVLVTETTVTEAPVVEQRTYVTYETVRVRVKHRRHIVRCTCRRAAPPPPPPGGGERG
jgi:Ni/Co efflux regulator RcnB